MAPKSSEKGSAPTKKKVAPMPAAAAGAAGKKGTGKNPLFEPRPRKFTIGSSLPPKRDLTRFVKWPKYVRLQRQRKIIYQRLKVPPSINAFTQAIDKPLAKRLVALLDKYRPEEKKEKKARLVAEAKEKASAKKGAARPGKKPVVVKFGLNHVTALVESKKAVLVVIAADVDPIELVVWLPALCRKMKVPYCIIRSKAILGQIVRQKTASCVALTGVRQEDKAELTNLINASESQFNERHDEIRRQWGGGVMGLTSQHRTIAREKALAKEKAGRANLA